MTAKTDLPRLRLTEAEFMALREYSHTLPTGQTPGKRWKARYPNGWFIGEYDPKGPVRGSIGITWYRPVILCARERVIAAPAERKRKLNISPAFEAASKRTGVGWQRRR